ncbi:hypothetical protein [Vibrio vulnificus YJ016]|uniref:Uncharacterized protein n=1 Tax=Vibrio vulnificus (strain YJ016) TaxID=196600 RepID=Q7MBQ9_VIBVY|nr:hypothetical protein [Vibrio vulnificus YJ016]
MRDRNLPIVDRDHGDALTARHPIYSVKRDVGNASTRHKIGVNKGVFCFSDVSPIILFCRFSPDR